MSLSKDLNNGMRCLVINVILFWIILGQKIPDFEEKPKNFFFKGIEKPYQSYCFSLCHIPQCHQVSKSDDRMWEKSTIIKFIRITESFFVIIVGNVDINK